MTAVRVFRRSSLRKIGHWRWSGALQKNPRRESAPLQEAEPTAVTDNHWYLYVPYAAPNLKITDPLVETVSGHEISIERTGSRYGGIAVKNLASEEDAKSVFAALKRGALAASLNLSTGIRVKEELTVLRENDASPTTRLNRSRVAKTGAWPASTSSRAK